MAAVLLPREKGKTDVCSLPADSLIAATEDPFKVCESSMYINKTKKISIKWSALGKM